MNAKRIVSMTLAVMVLAACNGRPPAGTAAPMEANTQSAGTAQGAATNTPVATEAPVQATEAPVTATDQPTNTPVPRPTNVAGCTNSASFVTDITIPDNTAVDGGAKFTKTWRIANTGTCIWAYDYTLSHYSEERMDAPNSVSLPITYPGQTADISVDLTAPNSLGTHRGYFVIKNPEGLIMKIDEDSRLWLIINVQTTSAATLAPTNTPAAGAPTATVSASGGGLANATCSYSIDQAKLLEMINAVNAYRGQFGMAAYSVNPQLARAAQSHASDMACNQLNGDVGSNGSTVKSRVAASGYTASFEDENVYSSNPPASAQDIVNKWVNDQTNTHPKLNLISDTFIEIGLGYAFFNDTGYYVIVFATP